MLSEALQAFLVLDFELSIDMKTAAAVLLGRRREALICAPQDNSKMHSIQYWIFAVRLSL